MAKQVIIAAMEEVLGEYILNMSKDNLKIAALRGQIKLENVQLDGDLFGSHVLGAVGLSSFGVLSCSARSIKISVPWKNLEKEPTRFEVKGVHLVCVPLTPSTANQMYGTGSAVDPRCTLRTRAKRLVLDRLERNFWNGQIPGEGPPMKRIQRAVKDVERSMRRSSSRSRSRKRNVGEDAEMDDLIENLVQNLGDSAHGDGSEQDSEQDANSSFYSTAADDLPELPRDWKVRLREKVLRNMEASMHDVHIRCEVPDQGLGNSGSEGGGGSGEGAFVLGFTLDSLVVRTANEKWEVGSHQKHQQSVSAMSFDRDHLGPNGYVAHNNKIGYFNKLSMYWDDSPPILLSETDALKGNYRKLSADKIQSRIGSAMDALFTSQEPGAAIRYSLSVDTASNVDTDRPHQYICEHLDAEVRVRTSDRTCPGPISCSADVLPFSFTFNVRPNQYRQYQKLKAAIKSQHRFDTMLRQRPTASPKENPRAWWKYVIACVTSRPNSRPWEDIRLIVRSRRRYIALVAKKNAKPTDRSGFHAGLSSRESAELLGLEDLLPIEALTAFHLVALRKVYESQNRKDASRKGSGAADSMVPASPSRKRGKSASRFRILRSSGARKSQSSYVDLPHEDSIANSVVNRSRIAPDDGSAASMSLLEAMTLRLGKKTWFVDWKLHDANVNVVLRHGRDDSPIVQLMLGASGSARSFGQGKRDFSFGVRQCEVLHGAEKVLFISELASGDGFAEDDETESFDSDHAHIIVGSNSSIPSSIQSSRHEGPDLLTPSTFLDLPPHGTVCRLAAAKDMDAFKLSISAHPATLVWTTSLLDCFTEFCIDRPTDLQADLTQHIRNAATPLARKAQLALLSPESFAFHLNIAAPKIWVPLVNTDGTLFLDAGTLQMASTKDEGETEAHWNVQARDIAVTFVRTGTSSKLSSESSFYRRRSSAGGGLPSSSAGRLATSVIRPFSIDASSRIVQDVIQRREVAFAEPLRNVGVRVSPICLNLVDAEVLARSFGKWYARGLHRVRRRVSSSTGNAGKSRGIELVLDGGLEHSVDSGRRSEVPRILSLSVEKVEMALEGHSKKIYCSDERSTHSMDSVQEYAPPTRAYLVELFRISVNRSKLGHTEITRLSVMDASIVRLKDVSSYTPQCIRRETIESENRILVRAGGNPGWDSMPPPKDLQEDAGENNARAAVLRATLLRNKVAHLDEVEVDIDSVVLRVTPTTLKDCAKAFRRIAELAQLMTKEMERKVHEEGRQARRRGTGTGRDGDGSLVGSVVASVLDRPISPTWSDTMTAFTEGTFFEEKKLSTDTFDSSILFKVTLNESTLLAGRPTTTPLTATTRSPSPQSSSPSYAVIQILSNALIMFQSIENPDATGTKTLHVSVDNVSALVNTEFERVSLTEAPPMIEPTGAEFRVVYATADFGCVVSQDVSVDCEAMKSCLTPNDLSIMVKIAQTMFERLRAFGIQNAGEANVKRKTALSRLIRYQKKGTGIATRLRAEIRTFSFVLLRAYKSHFGAPEFLDFNVKEVKGFVSGCMSALSGECSAFISVNFFNSEVSDWEYAVEPFPFTLSIEQMPNELVLEVAPSRGIQVNLTGVLLRDFSEMKFDVLRDLRGEESGTTAALNPSVLSTVGLRRATEARSVTVHNLTGIDIHVVPDTADFTPDAGLVRNGTASQLDTVLERFDDGDISLSLRIAESATTAVGEREPVMSLPLSSSSNGARLFLLEPTGSPNAMQPGHAQILRLLDGRVSPESILSEGLVLDSTYYRVEPVVEWCMQNQRVRPTIGDVFTLPKGRDLLSSNIWSPEDAVNQEDTMIEYENFCQEAPFESDGPEAAAGAIEKRPTSPEKVVATITNHVPHKSNWLRPYLKNDSPEWTDMTCMLSMARERVMLPDSKWFWINDWTVDINGNLGEETDADGWSYEADFETFSRKKRYYGRGDSCRRRRWTRTRMLKPPRIDDPFRQLKFVWETSKDDNGCISVAVRSHVRIQNTTASPLTYFVYTPSWDEDKLVGTSRSGEHVDVPIPLASAVYMRIAKNVGAQQDSISLADCVFSDRFSIVPTSHTSSSFLRTSIDLEDVSGTTLHFLVELRSNTGIVDVVIEPVFRLINLLPCKLECQIGQVLKSARTSTDDTSSLRKSAPKRIAMTETLKVPSGKEGASIAVNPWRKPHVSLRVPGYNWSAWERVVNRKPDDTWRPSEAEEERHFTSTGDAEYADELMSLVRFERFGRNGNPLTLILSIESGHCPTVRVYAQYWILDKTGFGCRFAEGFTDLLGNVPDPETSRRSFLTKEEAKDREIQADMAISGHQWSLGSSGMTFYFSQRKKLALSIETGIDRKFKGSKNPKSKWISPLDISNVVPKTVFSVDELNGPRRFELAIHVTLCPGLFARTKMISLLPRYQIVNLLHRELVIAQDGCLKAETIIPSQSSMSLHWEKGTLPPKVRLGAPSASERDSGNYERCWTNGRFQVDRIGITSLRLPTTNLVKIPMVVQVEVRLASKDQSSAVVVVIWSGNEKSNPLYTLRNLTRYTILCLQPLQDAEDSEIADPSDLAMLSGCAPEERSKSVFECGGTEFGPMVRSFLGFDRIEEFVWVLKPNDVTCFGFDDPEKPHILEWTYVDSRKPHLDKRLKKAFLEVDAMGSSTILTLPGGQKVRCHLRAEHSTKVIEFVEVGDPGRSNLTSLVGPEGLGSLMHFQKIVGIDEKLQIGRVDPVDDDETISFSLRIDVPAVVISVVDNAESNIHGREILLAQLERVFFAFSQTREGYHEFELRLMGFQVDNHVQHSIHPVLIFCPRIDEREPLLHMSAVRRLQLNSNTFVFRYAAIRLLEVDIFLDRRTAETIARFIQPLTNLREGVVQEEPPDWVSKLTMNMEHTFAKTDRRTPQDLEKIIHTANSGRIYVEQLHLHPVRLELTFTQEWIDMNAGSDTMMIFQFIRGMASIANAPLVFTSFVVGHVFEAPQALFRIVATHYLSQLTKQIFGILGSLAILGAPADFISNVGSGVRDFFYEPIQGAVHGPRQFIEGLEAGTQSLARGVFVGVVRGAANVADAVNSNLAGLTADYSFIDERKAHQRMLTDAMSRNASKRSFGDSLNLAAASFARGVKSGALGIVEQPSRYASKHGPVGFLKGVGKAVVGAIVKPVVGLGDGAVLVMNHMSDATSKKQVFPKIPKRLRRALPSRSSTKRNLVRLEPYDERAAKAQKIVTAGESGEDVYIGYVNIPSHQIVASEQCLWAIDRRSRDPWCVTWSEISHFGVRERSVRIFVFSQTGLKTYMFEVESSRQLAKVQELLSMQTGKMANASELNNSLVHHESTTISQQRIPGIRARQSSYVFGSCNNARKRLDNSVKDEIDLVEQGHSRIRKMDSSSTTYFRTLDEEAWSLVSSFGYLFSGLSSRRCIVAGIINGTGITIQIKSTKLVEGGSLCYSLGTKEYDTEQGILRAGGVIIFFGWGVVPNLIQPGSVFMNIETNGFTCDLADQKDSSTCASAMPGYQVGFLEKSYDEGGWWAKYWLKVIKM